MVGPGQVIADCFRRMHAKKDRASVPHLRGDGLFIHAASRGGEVKIDSLDQGYFRSRYLGARRVRGSDS